MPGQRPARSAMKVNPAASYKLGGATPTRLDRAEEIQSQLRPPELLGVPPRVQKASDDAFAGIQPYLSAAGGSLTSMLAGCNLGFLGFPFLAELDQISEYRQISERHAQEMTRCWGRYVSRGEGDKTERLKELTQMDEALQLRQHFRSGAALDGRFGRGHLYIDMGPTTDKELATPLDITPQKIKKGAKWSLKPIEPMFVYGYDYNGSDPLQGGFYEPTSWYVMKRVIHASRLLTFIGQPVPDILKPAYAFAGLSMAQLAMPTIENFLKMRKSIANIVLNYSLRGLKTNLQGLLAGGIEDLDSILTRMKVYVNAAANEGLAVLDKDEEDFFQHTTPLSTLDKLLEQARDNMCAVATIPRMVLFGLSPEGMNASADGELKVYEQFVSGRQEALFRPLHTRVMHMMMLTLWGEIDEDIEFIFNPLRRLDDKELAQIRLQNAQADNIYLSAAVVSTDEARKRISTDPASGWNNLQPDREVVPAVPPTAATPSGLQENRTGQQEPKGAVPGKEVAA